MASTSTPRLGLNKQDFRDNSWHTAMDAGFDTADAQFFLHSADFSNKEDPNVSVQCNFLGQIYVDATTTDVPGPRIWIGTVVASPGTWLLLDADTIRVDPAVGGDVEVQSALETHESRLDVLELTPFVPRGYIDGLELAYDNTTDVFVDPGESSDSSQANILTLATQWGKRADNLFSVGNSAGGLVAGITWNPSTTYHCFMVRRTSDGLIDFMFDPTYAGSNIAATDSGLWGKQRRLGAILTNASSQIIPFDQDGDYVWWRDPIKDVTYDSAACNLDTGSLETLSVPSGVKLQALLAGYFSYGEVYFRGSANDRTEPVQLRVEDPALTAFTPITFSWRNRRLGAFLAGQHRNTAPSPDHLYTFVSQDNNLQVRTNTSGQVYLRTNYAPSGAPLPVDAENDIRIYTRGWIDPRGKNQ